MFRIMFRMNGTSRLSTRMCDAKRVGDHISVQRVLAVATRTSAPSPKAKPETVTAILLKP